MNIAKKTSESKKRDAFTLIELSIVLVVIGLIIGGILLGQDLYEVAKLRAAGSQLNSFTLAAQTFKLKYADLPGDIPASRATQFGLSSRYAGWPDGGSDGSGDLEQGFTNGNNWSIKSQEFILFWNDLSRAGLIGEGLNSILGYFDTVPGESYALGNCSFNPMCMPRSKWKNDYISIIKWSGRNYYLLANSDPQYVSPARIFSPLHAYSFDSKFDDGNPTSGRVLSVSTGGTYNYLAGNLQSLSGATECKNSDVTYNTSGTYGNLLLCGLVMTMGIN